MASRKVKQTKQTKLKWKQAETNVKNWLRRYGVKSTHQSYDTPIDLLTEAGLGIEVKYASFRTINKRTKQKGFTFNLHRHNRLDESAVRFYCLVLGPDNEGFLRKTFTVLVLPAPLNRRTIQITPRSLLMKFGGRLNDWKSIADAERGR